eukprot:scaffold76690_cov63-Phaeocystis_antarctica.AAC.1
MHRRQLLFCPLEFSPRMTGGWRLWGLEAVGAGGWRGWRLEAGGWRLEAGGWRLEAGGWRLREGWRLGANVRAWVRAGLGRISALP